MKASRLPARLGRQEVEETLSLRRGDEQGPDLRCSGEFAVPAALAPAVPASAGVTRAATTSKAESRFPTLVTIPA